MSVGFINPTNEKKCVKAKDLSTKRKAKRKAKRKPVVEVEIVRAVCCRAHIYLTHCAGCGREVELVTFDDAAKIIGTNRDAIIRLAAGAELHLGIVPEALLVCLNSLLEIAVFNGSVNSSNEFLQAACNN
jgi:hypothetical protein